MLVFCLKRHFLHLFRPLLTLQKFIVCANTCADRTSARWNSRRWNRSQRRSVYRKCQPLTTYEKLGRATNKSTIALTIHALLVTVKIEDWAGLVALLTV